MSRRPAGRSSDHDATASTLASTTTWRTRLGSNPVSVWAIKHLASPLDRLVIRLFRGHLPQPSSLVLPTLLLTTRGRVSGQDRTIPLVYLQDDDRFVVANARPANERPNPWVANLRAAGKGQVRLGRRTVPVTARELDGAELDDWWPRLCDVWPAFAAHYGATGDRTVFLLLPSGNNADDERDQRAVNDLHEPGTRSVERHQVSPERRLVTEALRLGRKQAPIHGLVDIDITTARQRIQTMDPAPSTTALVVAAVGRAAARHPEVHGYLDWRGRLVTHRHVDIATLFEVTTPSGTFPLGHLIVDADTRSVADISDEIRAVRADPSSSPGGRLLDQRTLAPIITVPGVVILGYRLASRSVRLRRRTGTVAVTAVGMFGGGAGFGIAAPTLPTLGIVVGGITRRPRVIDEQIVIRDVLDLTITVDHRLVDGAPVARFAADLRQILETELLAHTSHVPNIDTTREGEPSPADVAQLRSNSRRRNSR